uniref:Uncharacterized protein n=1 Tax=Arundo donax TaxID=35708 RepID=A0A0A9CN30_ARUDO
MISKIHQKYHQKMKFLYQWISCPTNRGNNWSSGWQISRNCALAHLQNPDMGRCIRGILCLLWRYLKT